MSDFGGQDQSGGRVKEINSTANPIVKDIKGLFLKKNRDASGLFIAEGLKLVADALETGWKIKTLIYSKNTLGQKGLAEIAARCRAKGADILEVNDKVLTAISRRDNPQTIIGVFHQSWSNVDEIAQKTKSNSDVIVALDRVRDPGNLGTILRTCDAVGVKGILLIGETTDPFSIEATRATMGSVFHVPMARMSESEFLEWRKTFKGRIAGTHLEGAADYRKIDWQASPTLLLMGNEQQGLTDALAETCDDVVIIPMAGKADSLNLAIATGVMLFEIRRSSLTLETHSFANSFEKKADTK
ncbi:MAG: RNA methyltransferase [Salaquimonas sp.]